MFYYSCCMMSNPKSDGFGGGNPNLTDSDFMYIHHIPKCQCLLERWTDECTLKY
jgi:hypothetical protein